VKAHPALFDGEVEEEESKNEGLLFQSTIDIFQFTFDIHFQNTLLLPLSLLLCSLALLLPNLKGSHSVSLLFRYNFVTAPVFKQM
jgi:hypothetical protein